jgi:hypothetical protein
MSELGVSGNVPDITYVIDTDKDGEPNATDLDDDGDGVLDASDLAPLDPETGRAEWCDATTNICWQMYPHAPIDGISATEAVQYCNELSVAGRDDWELPTIDQLRTLIRGNSATEPEGSCGISANCDSSCYTSECDGGAYLQGPGQNGCYWDAELEGDCEQPFATRPLTGDPLISAFVYFGTGAIILRESGFADPARVRCMHPND